MDVRRLRPIRTNLSAPSGLWGPTPPSPGWRRPSSIFLSALRMNNLDQLASTAHRGPRLRAGRLHRGPVTPKKSWSAFWQALARSSCLRRSKASTGEPSHQHLFDPLPSSQPLRSVRSHISRLTKSFFPWVIQTKKHYPPTPLPTHLTNQSHGLSKGRLWGHSHMDSILRPSPFALLPSTLFSKVFLCFLSVPHVWLFIFDSCTVGVELTSFLCPCTMTMKGHSFLFWIFLIIRSYVSW